MGSPRGTRLERAIFVPAAAIVIAASCDHSGDGEVPPDLRVLAFDTAVVRLTTHRDTVLLTLELAVTGEQQRLGLMERRHLPELTGMLFVYDSTRPPDAGFWMYRTRIPLDIAFLDSAGVIRAIRTMEPCTSEIPGGCPTYAPGTHYQYALELNSGVLHGLGADVGAQLLVGDLVRRGETAK
jgi:hypothetical protein